MFEMMRCDLVKLGTAGHVIPRWLGQGCGRDLASFLCESRGETFGSFYSQLVSQIVSRYDLSDLKEPSRELMSERFLRELPSALLDRRSDWEN